MNAVTRYICDQYWWFRRWSFCSHLLNMLPQSVRKLHVFNKLHHPIQ